MTRFRLPAALVALGLAACSSPAPVAVPEGPPTLSGALVSVRHSATASGLLVEPDEGACSLLATADAQTRVLRRSPSGRVDLVGTGAAGVGALAVGDPVAVYVEGEGHAACPMEGRAAVVVVEPARVDLGLLLGHWVHSREEDTGAVEVYRPEGSRAFPPSLYRQQYVFRADGRAEVLVPDPADAHRLHPGTWAADRGGAVVVREGGRAERLRVVSLSRGRLRVVRAAA